MKNSILMLSLIMLSLTCCEDKALDTGLPQFNIELFETSLVDSLKKANLPGFSYAINQNQLLYSKGAGGFATYNPSSTPNNRFTPELRMHIASISKTITAAAVLKILARKAGVGVDSPVLPYLPNTWTIGPNVQNLTFRNLLTHKSGFIDTTGNGTYNSLRTLIQKGLDESKRGGDNEYYNDNYSLFRIILPRLAGKPELVITSDLIIAWEYMQIIHEELFNPMGIPEAFCKPLPNQVINYYNCSIPAIADGSDLTLRCGAYGWNLSALDLAAFMAHLRYNNAILDPTTRQLMDEGILGWENEHSSANGDHGTYLFHSGQYHYGESNAGGLRTCIMKFAETKVEVSLLMNCVDHPNPNIRSPRRILKIVFDNSWE